jgi:hypothetical protein
MKTFFVEKLLLVTGFTTKLSLHFYDFLRFLVQFTRLRNLTLDLLNLFAPRPLESFTRVLLKPWSSQNYPRRHRGDHRWWIAGPTRPGKRLGRSTCSPSMDWWCRLRRGGLWRPSLVRSRQRTRPCSDSGEGSGVPQQCAARGASTGSKGEVRVVGGRRHRAESGASRWWRY